MANDFFSLSERFSEHAAQSAASEVSSAALLALGRSVRGAFRQVGLAVVALLFVVNLSGHAEIAVDQANYFGTQPAAQTSAQISAQESVQINRPTSLLQASLTHHRLTGARLSRPPLSLRTVASLSDTPSNAAADVDVESVHTSSNQAR